MARISGDQAYYRWHGANQSAAADVPAITRAIQRAGFAPAHSNRLDHANDTPAAANANSRPIPTNQVVISRRSVV